MAQKKSSGVGLLLLLMVGMLFVFGVPKTGFGIFLFMAALIVGFVVLANKADKAEDAPVPDAQVIAKMKSMREESTVRSSETFNIPEGRILNTGGQDIPITVTITTRFDTPRPSEHRLPEPPQTYGQAQWYAPGRTVTVAGCTIPGGMVYVGTRLEAGYSDVDPCLIDPSKTVASHGDYTLRQMDYWPSYSRISPEARKSYLLWLEDGRKDPEADIGFVFLFFYGLERRAVLDAAQDDAARNEWPAIAQEVQRLLDIYGNRSGSFSRYAHGLLDWLSLAGHPSKLYLQPLPDFSDYGETPIYLKLAMGQAAVDGVPLPAELALAWVRTDANTFLRTPAVRCANEFERLFKLEYERTYGAGLVLTVNRTKLKLMYTPASSGFRSYDELKLHFNGVPDVTVMSAPLKKLQAIAEAATVPLESFSRALARNPQARESLDTLLLLPVELWPERAMLAMQALKARVGDGLVALSYQELLQSLGAGVSVTKDKTLSLARALEALNLGVEPDVLCGAKTPKLEDKVVVFSLVGADNSPRNVGAYLAATLTLQLASAVAASDGEFGVKELAHLRESVTSWTHLPPNQTKRLLAHLRLLMLAPVSLASLKKKLEPLDQGVRETLAAFMATVAQSDGEVSPAEVKLLEKVYKVLGVDAKKVFVDVHAVAAGKPVSMQTIEAVESSGFKLDAQRIAELQRDTEKVSALLSDIFIDPDATSSATLGKPDAQDDSASQGADNAEASATEGSGNPAARAAQPYTYGLQGLDDAHMALVRVLMTQTSFTRAELLDVASDMDLMLDGALEKINEASFDAYDVPLIEGDDPMTLNSEFLDKAAA